MNTQRSSVALGLAAATLAMAPASAQTLTVIPPIAGVGESFGSAVTPDGLTVVGYSSAQVGPNYYNHGFRWTQGGGGEDLGTLPGGVSSHSYAFAVNSSGSVVVGANRKWLGIANDNWELHSTRRVGNNPTQDLGVLCNCYNALSEALAVSADGSVLAGYAAAPGFRAYRWTQAGGVVNLGTGGGVESFGRGITADGSAIIGNSWNANNTHNAVRWPASGGHQLLPVAGGYAGAAAYAVNADGSAIVGFSHLATGERHATRWLNDVPEVLGFGTIVGESNATALAVNAGGDIVVGETAFNIPNGAWAWNQTRGVTRLSALFASEGIDTTGWSAFQECTGISADGMTLVGTGTYLGQPRAFYINQFDGLCGPWIYEQPQSVAVCAGGTASFFVTAYGPTFHVPSFQWYRPAGEFWLPVLNGPYGGATVSGATTPQVTFTNVTPDIAGEYFCYITAGCGEAVSVHVTLTVNTQGPNIVFHPGNQNVCPNGSASFSVTHFNSQNDAPFAYQWEREVSPNVFAALYNGTTTTWDGNVPGAGGIVSGAQTDTMTIAADTGNGRLLTAAHSRYYRCTVTNACASALSNQGGLKVYASCIMADMNGDQIVDFFDIDPFLLLLFNSAAYAEQYPDVNPANADCDGNHVVDFFDIDPFLACLFGACP